MVLNRFNSQYKINGTVLLLQPTSGKWLDREKIGIDGNGVPVYSAYRSFELAWDLVDEESLYQLQTYWETMLVTGSIVADLPNYKSHVYPLVSGSFSFHSYSGCVIHEPTFEDFWEYQVGSAKLLISRIRT
jgi:hypothetical protein